MTSPQVLTANTFKPGVRIRCGHRVGRIVMPWLDGKWAVQFPHHPRGSYTILRPDRMTILGKEPSL